ncbi:phage major capsid protein [Mycobacterium sp. PS03-16]|uniref:phage major capsid protein n=1 Tax=Mycobacterium sp. PS03-16 TaxID=2559611 RepID=UPI00107388A5|nr:phage major capsid protein [Mycobacterium sp. PS03-16]TFV61405.1 phage major capsid protein [Mycobacterium sp. PS03-16]
MNATALIDRRDDVLTINGVPVGPLFGSEPNPAETDPGAPPVTVEEILAALQSIIDAAEGRPLSEDEIKRYETLEGQLRTVQRSAEIRSRQAAYTTPVPGGLASVVHTGAVRRDDTLERAFDHYLRTGRENQDITELRAQGTSPDTAGGFLVPETMRQKLTERLKAFGGLASAVEEIVTTSGEPLRWPTLDDTANVGVITPENTAPASGGADLVFGEKTLGAFKYVAPGANNLPLRVSVELLQDSAFDIQALVERKLGERIGRRQALDWVSGNGTTEPFGIDTGTTVAVDTFDAATPTYDELVDAVHQVDPAYRAAAVWTFNDQTLAQIERLVDGSGRPLLNPAAEGISSGPANTTLLGYPVIIDQAWPTYADATTGRWGAFGDLRSGYVIRRVKDLTLIVNPYSRANEGQVEYTLWARADGVPQDTNAYRVLINETA